MKERRNDTLGDAPLSAVEAHALLLEALAEPVEEPRLARLLTALNERGVAASELEGFSNALLDLATPVDLGGAETIDVCGTGGDGRDTFNISTATAFVLAGAGYRVAKHGNYGVSSSCGSSNVLEALGVTFSTSSDALRRDLERSNVCFIHAPLFHPAMRRAAPVRKALGCRTVFNMLGPLVNPARPQAQLSGVYDRALLPLYREVLSRRGTRFTTLFGDEGYDEVTLTGNITISTPNGERSLSPDYFDLPLVRPQELRSGASVEESARILRDILSGEGTPAQEAVVIANAALAIVTVTGTESINNAVERAQESIRSGRARESLQKSVERP